jgi:hypothetical protein
MHPIAAAPHRLRARLLALASSTVLATGGLTALGAATDPAAASVLHTRVFVADVNGGLGVYDATSGTQTFMDDHLGGLPLDLVADPNGTTLYEIDTMDDQVGVFSAQTYAGLGGVGVCNRPQYGALDTATQTLYVSCNTSNGGVDVEVDAVNVSNPASPVLTARIPFATQPTTMAVDTATNTLFVNDTTGIARVSTITNTVLSQTGVPTGWLALNPSGTVVYDATGTMLYLITANNGSVFASIPMPVGAGSMALCPSSGIMYIAGTNVTTLFNTSTLKSVGSYPLTGVDLAVSPNCSQLFEVNSSSVETVNTTTGAIGNTTFPTNEILTMAVANVPITLIYHPSPSPFPFSATASLK